MDRALKERIIGAIVLVAFVVLVVPVFLNGPSDHGGEVSAAITLPGQNGQTSKQQTIVLNRNRTEPVPSMDNDPAPQTVPQAGGSASRGDTPRATAPSPASPDSNSPAAPAASQVESVTGMWAVQLGSFSDKKNAERLAADLRADGYAAFLSKLSSGDGSLHRVRVGPQKDRAEAEAVARRLASEEQEGQVVPHP